MSVKLEKLYTLQPVAEYSLRNTIGLTCTFTLKVESSVAKFPFENHQCGKNSNVMLVGGGNF